MPQEVAILIPCLMIGIHINFGDIVDVQNQRKALIHNCSMPFLVFTSKLCDNAGIRYFSFDEPVPSGGVIDVEKKRDVGPNNEVVQKAL